MSLFMRRVAMEGLEGVAVGVDVVGRILLGLCDKCGKKVYRGDLEHVCRKKGRRDMTLRKWFMGNSWRSPIWQRPVIGRSRIKGSKRSIKVFGHVRLVKEVL